MSNCVESETVLAFSLFSPIRAKLQIEENKRNYVNKLWNQQKLLRVSFYCAYKVMSIYKCFYRSTSKTRLLDVNASREHNIQCSTRYLVKTAWWDVSYPVIGKSVNFFLDVMSTLHQGGRNTENKMGAEGCDYVLEVSGQLGSTWKTEKCCILRLTSRLNPFSCGAKQRFDCVWRRSRRKMAATVQNKRTGKRQALYYQGSTLAIFASEVLKASRPHTEKFNYKLCYEFLRSLCLAFSFRTAFT